MTESPVAVRAAERLPGWAGSIRFRLMVLYSVLLFGLATVVVGGIYAGWPAAGGTGRLPHRGGCRAVRDADCRDMIRTLEFEVQDPLAVFEREVNEQALDQLRTYAFGALGLLFIGSLGVGWFVAGLVLRPVGRITSVARTSGTDLYAVSSSKGLTTS